MSDPIRDALRGLVTAWEATPPGKTTPQEIQRWLVEDMKPAIDRARAVLSAPTDVGRLVPKHGSGGSELPPRPRNPPPHKPVG